MIRPRLLHTTRAREPAAMIICFLLATPSASASMWLGAEALTPAPRTAELPATAIWPFLGVGGEAIRARSPALTLLKLERARYRPEGDARESKTDRSSPGSQVTEYFLEFHGDDPADTLDVEHADNSAADSTEYYLDFQSGNRPKAAEAGLEPRSEPDTNAPPSTRPGTTEYYLKFESQGPADSLKSEPDSLRSEEEVLEIEIDDEGVRIEPSRPRNRIEVRVGTWDEPEDHICDREEFDGGRGRFDYGLGLSYQRVDGLSVILKQDLSHHDWRVPSIYLREIYSSKQSKWFYDVGIEQMINLRLPLYLGASAYKVTDSNPIDKEIIDSSENSLAAFFLKEDYRDYFTRNGASLHARLEFPGAGALQAKFLNDEYSSLEKNADWSLFRQSADFRPNPPIDDGEMKSVIVSYTLDKRSDVRCLTSGPWIRFSVEKAGDDLGGDFDFTSVFLDARNHLKLSPSQFLRYRLMVGSRTQGQLPLQKQFYVGGIGTLRGHDYKELTGDQMILGNIEYGAYADKNIGLFVFVDSGKAWYGDGGFLDQRLELDGGVGIELLCHQAHIYAAKDLKDSDSPILVGLRLNRTF